MAEAVMRAELKKRKIRWYTVKSAGIQARENSVVSAESVQALREAGIPFAESFRPRRLTEKMIEEAYAVVCMTEDQRLPFSEFTNVTSMYELSGKEIPDPYGRGIDVYRATLQVIRDCMPRVIKRLRIGENQEIK